ncbi:MAG: hypothetical protein RQ899_13270 [Pseudomonadales bacterium]|nr:hypothetical protein [Pseudomonadales bacterium]
MQIFLTALILGLLIAFLIRELHKFQVRATHKTIDETTPLPPLEPAPGSSNEPKPGPLPVASSSTLAETSSHRPAGTWQDKVKTARNQDAYAQALALCSAQYPKIEAFQQALITLRAEIKTRRKQQLPIADTLLTLYRTAVLADLLRSDMVLNADSSSLDMSAFASACLAEFDFPYRHIGYQKLRLLNKTDCKRLVECWQEPDTHRHADEFLGSDWSRFVASFAAREPVMRS